MYQHHFEFRTLLIVLESSHFAFQITFFSEWWFHGTFCTPLVSTHQYFTIVYYLLYLYVIL